MRKALYLAACYLALAGCAGAQQFEFPETATGDTAALSKAMPILAKQVIAAYKEDDRERYLDNLFRLQLVAGEFSEAASNIGALRELRRPANAERAAWANLQYEIYARAKQKESADKQAFAEAYAQVFRETFGKMEDRIAALVIRSISTVGLPGLQQDLRNDLEQRKGKSEISLADALHLIRSFQIAEAYRSFQPLAAELIAADDARRYIVKKEIPVKTPDGATVCTLVVLPRKAPARLPALLNFTIYADANNNLNEARRTASNGYAGVIGLTRGKGCSPDTPVPYEYDSADAAALIDWISTQEWSDGRVGMFGGSYEGFTAWAATKRMPKALKAILAGAPVGPGIDVPMEGNIFWNFVYPWTFYTLNVKGLDDATYYNNARWRKLNMDWYTSGRAYRELENIDGTPNPIFQRWISHPSYDAYWQNMIPYQNEFARIRIPVLQTAGYYYGGPGAAVSYMSQHYKYDPKAEHYLVIGPYDHVRGHRGTVNVFGDPVRFLSGYRLEPAAQIDMGELRYQWFDYVLKGGPKPALLKDKVNYQVTGTNAWKHAPSLAAMANQSLRFHLSPARSGENYRLSEQKPEPGGSIEQTVNLADRSDADAYEPGGGVIDKALNTLYGVAFVSDPLPNGIEVSGLFSGRLEFTCNQKDFDFNIGLFELTTSGEYVQLAPYWARASYVGDPSHRRLLTLGKRQRLDIQSVRLMSRQIQPGSRLVVVLSVIKEGVRQINYGTGKDVSDEIMLDAKAPLQIKWYSESYIQIPVWK